jgi:polar amino acid transport system substrate-binding protein
MTGIALDRRTVMSGLALAAMIGGCVKRKRQPGEVVIGSTPTGVPFSFVDPWTNELTGSMIDMAKAISAAMALKPDFAITPFVGLIPSLAAGKIDMLAAAMVRTPEREKIVAFSEPVLPDPDGLIVQAGDRGRYPDLASLRHMRVGAQLGTRFIDQLQEAGVEQIATYEGLSDILREVSIGRIQAGYGDAPILRYQLRVGPRRNARMVSEFKAPSLEQLCFVVRKDDPMLPKLNASILRLRPQLMPEISRRWHLAEAE